MRVITIIGLLILGGCSLYTPPVVEPIETPVNFKEAIKVNNADLEMNWWKNFNDENLNKLVDEAVQNNVSYQMALNNIDIAKTYISEATFNLLPNAGVGYTFNRARFNNSNVSLDGFDARLPDETFAFDYLYGSVSYDVDLWGKKRNTRKEAIVNVGIHEAESRSVKLSLVSEVVNVYFQIATVNANIENLQRQLDIANAFVKIANAQYKSGFSNDDVVRHAGSQKNVIQRDLKNLKKQQKIYMNYLAYLLGEYPENFYYQIKPIKQDVHFEKLLPPSVPAQVLANRPDIQTAFLQVILNGYIEKKALADFLPSFKLFALYGDEKFTVAEFAQDSLLALYGFNIVESLTDAAINISKHERAQEQYENAALNYKNTVLNAFQEVNNALLSFNEDQGVLVMDQEIEHAAYEDFQYAEKQYKSGLVDYATYLNYESLLLERKYTMNYQVLLMYRDIIQIYKTLGMGVAEGYSSDTLPEETIQQNELESSE